MIRFPVTCGLLVVAAVSGAGTVQAQKSLSFTSEDGKLIAKLGDQSIFHYVFKDPQIPRPYFAHVKTPSSIAVSRNHPPQKGVDKDDHATMHPGIWLSFGDLNGNDYWRLKSETRHKEFRAPARIDKGRGSFEVINEYLSSDRSKIVCTETCHVTVTPFGQGYVLKIASELTSADAGLVFGDQEEMGLGVRLATRLAVDSKLGGRILDSEGRKNGAEIWGKTATWCDYAGPVDGEWVGMTILTSPKNFRPSWSHARDYGFVAMNPFGLNAFTKAVRKDIVVKRGDKLRLGFAVVVHESRKESDYNPKEVYELYAAEEAN